MDAETFTAIAAGAEYFPEYMLPGTGGTVNVHCRWAGLPKGVRWETLEWRGVAHGCGALILLMGMQASMRRLEPGVIRQMQILMERINSRLLLLMI